MIYNILDKEIEITTMQKPEGYHGSVFEFHGSESLNEIGLNKIFWFKSLHGFSNVLPISNLQSEINKPENKYQEILKTLLEKCISNGKLID